MSRFGRICSRRWKLFAFLLLAFLPLGGQAIGAEIAPATKRSSICNILLLGEIEPGDEQKFRAAAVSAIRGGCESLIVTIYSPGGSYVTALAIAKDVQSLHATTAAPDLISSAPKRKVDGDRRCSLLVDEKGEAEIQRRMDVDREAILRAFQQRTAIPEFDPLPGGFNPRTGRGDARCTCASACFFIWAAGAERRGDVVLIHRPYFDAQQYKLLTMSDAREAMHELNANARRFLTEIDLPSALIDKLFATPSDKASYLSEAEVKSLRESAYYGELKIARCGSETGPEPMLPSDANDTYSGPYKHLSPADRRGLRKQIKRQICWLEAQREIRQSINAAFLRKYGH